MTISAPLASSNTLYVTIASEKEFAIRATSDPVSGAKIFSIEDDAFLNLCVQKMLSEPINIAYFHFWASSEEWEGLQLGLITWDSSNAASNPKNIFILDFRMANLREKMQRFVVELMKKCGHHVYYDARQQSKIVNRMMSASGSAPNCRICDLAVVERAEHKLGRMTPEFSSFARRLYNTAYPQLNSWYHYARKIPDGALSMSNQIIYSLPMIVLPEALHKGGIDLFNNSKLLQLESLLAYAHNTPFMGHPEVIEATKSVQQGDPTFLDWLSSPRSRVAPISPPPRLIRPKNNAVVIQTTAPTHKNGSGKGNVRTIPEEVIQKHRELLDDPQRNELDLRRFIEVLPDFMQHFLVPYQHKLVEIVLDYSRPVVLRVFTDASKNEMEDIWFDNGPFITFEHLDYIVYAIASKKGVNVDELFGEDNRTGIDGTLHRISCQRNRQDRIIGLTMRIGKVVSGSLLLVDDLIQDKKSILLVGMPGSGKSTMLRQIIKWCSCVLKERVVVVDTSCEIGGDGDALLPSLGRARRLQVKKINKQPEVMIQAVQNMTPSMLVVDEMGTRAEAASASTIARRGVRMAATVHGDSLESVMKNKELELLFGSPQSVLISDRAAQSRAKNYKQKTVKKTTHERRTTPVFDIAFELRSFDEVAVYTPVIDRVDDLLHRGRTTIEVRKLVAPNRIEIRHEVVETEL